MWGYLIFLAFRFRQCFLVTEVRTVQRQCTPPSGNANFRNLLGFDNSQVPAPTLCRWKHFLKRYSKTMKIYDASSNTYQEVWYQLMAPTWFSCHCTCVLSPTMVIHWHYTSRVLFFCSWAHCGLMNFYFRSVGYNLATTLAYTVWANSAPCRFASYLSITFQVILCCGSFFSDSFLSLKSSEPACFM